MTRFSEIAHDIESQYDPDYDLDASKTAPPVSYVEYRLLELCEDLDARLTALEAAEAGSGLVTDVGWGELPFTGGGGFSGIAICPHDETTFAVATDTGGIQIVRNGRARYLNDGLPGGLLHAATVLWSRVKPGRLYAAGGDGKNTNSWLAVADNVDTDNPTPWIALQTNNTSLTFCEGSAFGATTLGGVTVTGDAGFPRSFSQIIWEDSYVGTSGVDLGALVPLGLGLGGCCSRRGCSA